MKKNIIFILLLTFQFIWSNNLKITNITKNSDTQLQFDVTWDNSWFTNGYNDAVWVFIKVKETNDLWHHLDVTNASATADLIILPIPTDKKGIFIRRNSIGMGTVSGTVTFNFITSPFLGPFPDFKVFGIEMVNVQAGNFYIGDGSLVNQTNTFEEFQTSGTPYMVTSPSQISVGNNFGIKASTTLTIDIPATFPKGYDDFYITKYEISAEQYTEFLNTLTAIQQQNRTKTDLSNITASNRFVMSSQSFPYSRNPIACDTNANTGAITYNTPPILFYCDYNNNQIKNEIDDGQNIACSQLTFNDNLAYLDWAGLRPITDIEYEKAARGLNFPTTDEFANGSTQILESGTVINEAEKDETVSNLNSNYLVNYFGTSVFGPLRVGIFASTTTNRVQSGGSFFGAMDLTGNIAELVVETRNVNSNNFNYAGSLGDGYLDSNGNNDEWIFKIDYFLSKGGSFILQNTNEFTVSYRKNSYSSAYFDIYSSVSVGNVRGCR